MGIFKDLFGNKAADDIFNKIDSIVDNIPLKKNHDQYDTMVNNTLKDILNANDTDSPEDVEKKRKNKTASNLEEVEKLLQGITVPEQRLRRYETYDDIYKSIQLVKRVIKVYLNNIFQKDPVTNTMILIKESEKSKNHEKLDIVKKTTREMISYFKLEEKLKYNVTFNLLKYGDSFIEIINLDEVNVKFPVVNSDTDDAIITETYNQLNSKNQYRQDLGFKDLEYFLECLVEFEDGIYLDEEAQAIEENKFDEETADFAKYNYKRILLNYHKPHRIIPLISPYDKILGYVEVKESERASNSANILKQFTDVIDKIGSKYPSNSEKYDTVIKKFSGFIVKKVLLKYNIKKSTMMSNDQYAEAIQKNIDPEIYYALKNILLSANEEGLFRKKLKVRFIHPDDMIWFRTPGSDFYPFGQSVIDPMVFPGKLYMFTNLANTVYKLSKASQVRKWTLETGSKQDHSAMLQKLKRGFRNMRITASDLSNTKDLPNILSDFRDLVVFSKYGQKFLDVELLPMGDPNIKTADLDNLQQQLVSLSGIPSSHLNIPEAIDMREQLVNINVNMAHEISSIQSVINEQIQILVDTLGARIGFEENLSNFVTLQLTPPTQLTLQLIEASLVSVGNIFSIFKDVPGITINPVSLLKKYVPYVDWDEMLKEGRVLDISNKVIPQDQAADAATQMSGQPNF